MIDTNNRAKKILIQILKNHLTKRTIKLLDFNKNVT